MQTSHLTTSFPVLGLAALPPAPHSLGGDIFVIGSPQHHRFDAALRAEEEDAVPASIIRLRPFYYVFNKTILGTEKVPSPPPPPSLSYHASVHQCLTLHSQGSDLFIEVTADK